VQAAGAPGDNRVRRTHDFRIGNVGLPATCLRSKDRNDEHEGCLAKPIMLECPQLSDARDSYVDLGHKGCFDPGRY
jgi:hypothetical protein